MHRFRTLGRGLALLACLVTLGFAAAACGAATGAPPPAQAPTSPAAQAPAATEAPAATAAPTSTTATALAASAAPTASAPLAQPAAGVQRVVLAAQANEARFRAREQLAGQSLPVETVGTTTDVSGGIAVDATGAIIAEHSVVTVDLRNLTSDQSRRDNYIKNNTLEISRFPTAEFVAQEVTGLPSPAPAAGEARFQLAGDLRVHGVTRPVVWDVVAQFADGEVTGSATTSVRLEDFGMKRPIVGQVMSIEETLLLELDFAGVREG